MLPYFIRKFNFPSKKRKSEENAPLLTKATPPLRDTPTVSNVVFLIMRKMRPPLLVLISVYTLALVGMTLMPGRDAQGQIWYMDFFHAFYFVSYMGTTIGFGEIPYAFSGAQRMWATFSLYLTVVAWIYAIGSLLTLVQNEALQRAIVERRFARTVKRIHEPFYLICGYGDTGGALVRALGEYGLRSVVIEIKRERIDMLMMKNYPIFVPRLCTDAGKPAYLIYGGLKNPNCAGVVAITNDNLVNLHIAITAKLLNPALTVICRVDAHEVAANMASFKTDYLINPFDVFAIQLHKALHTPNLHVLREWLTNRRKGLAFNVLKPPRYGVWVLCGYGRFGKAVYEQLKEEKNIHLVVVESLPRNTGYPACECVIGHGTEAHTLQQAHIEEATGIVAGTDDDVKNLSIVMTARELNPSLFVVIRQNSAHNRIIFEALQADVTMQPNQIVADHIRILLTTPLLADFLSLARQCDDVWTCELIERLNTTLESRRPNVWETTLNQTDAPAVCEALVQGQPVAVGHLLCDPRAREEKLRCIPLLLVRDEQNILLPEESEQLKVGDIILWCGVHHSEMWTKSWMEWTLRDSFVLTYLLTGQVVPRSYVWQWWKRHQATQA